MSDLKSILNKYQLKIDFTQIQSIEWLTQDSHENAILFYRFNQRDETEIKAFENRVSKTKYKFCFTNLGDQTQSTPSVIHLEHDDFLSLQVECMEKLYPLNLSSVKLCGVTGTNGKTTVVHLAEQLLLSKNINVLTIGTLGVRKNGKNLEANRLITSLSYIDLHKCLYNHQEDVEFICMEITSHGLDQGRFGHLKFHNLAWTNFSQDHLDYHQSMNNYFAAKLKILNHRKPTAKLFIPESQKELIEKVDCEPALVKLKGRYENLFFKVKYNQDNLALALALVGVSEDKKTKVIDTLTPPPGRFNVMPYNDSLIIIDYAHTPDGIRAITEEIKENFPNKNLITLFGCGGDRDRSKRVEMGKAASMFSDQVIITSDNPRFEDPHEIIKDILPGVTVSKKIEVDRNKAIVQALDVLTNDILLIAGKGHEPYLDIKGKKIPYNDQDVVDNYLAKRKVNNSNAVT